MRRNKLFACGAAVILCLCILSGVALAAGSVTGDVNNDGNTNAADASLMLKKGESKYTLAAALITRYSVGLLDTLPADAFGNPEQSTPPIPADFRMGDIWTVDGQWCMAITGVSETKDRNPYSDKSPASVYIVDYVYANLGYDSPWCDGLYLSIDDSVIDSQGCMGYSYPGDITNYPGEVPIGSVCHAQACIGVVHSGGFVLTVSMYDGNENNQKASFFVDVNAASVDVDLTDRLPKPVDTSFQMGQTWLVDGQWKLTVTGVKETNDRNPYSDKTPAAVYIVDYTYTNLGYVSDYMDGLFFSLDSIIVDSAGETGYSYPGGVSSYPKEVPAGATCNAQVCIGVNHAGTFRITETKYDSTGSRRSATFTVAP